MRPPALRAGSARSPRAAAQADRVREALREAVRLLRAQPLRSALTLFGLVWGTAAVIFLVSWGRGLQTMMETAF